MTQIARLLLQFSVSQVLGAEILKEMRGAPGSDLAAGPELF